MIYIDVRTHTHTKKKKKNIEGTKDEELCHRNTTLIRRVNNIKPVVQIGVGLKLDGLRSVVQNDSERFALDP